MVKLLAAWVYAILVDLALLCRDNGVKLDLPKRAFILPDVLLQNCEQSLGLLRAEIDALKVLHLNFLCCHGLQATKNQQKVPHAYADLYRIGVSIAVIGGVDQANVGLLRNCHGNDLPESKLS